MTSVVYTVNGALVTSPSNMTVTASLDDANTIGEAFGGTLPQGVKAHYIEDFQGPKALELKQMYKENGNICDTSPMANDYARNNPAGYITRLLRSL